MGTKSSGLNLQLCRLTLLQADGATTHQSLWVGRDLLQFSMSCEQICSSPDCRFKVMVCSKQEVLCSSLEMFVHNNKKVEVGRGEIMKLENRKERNKFPEKRRRLKKTKVAGRVDRIKLEKREEGLKFPEQKRRLEKTGVKLTFHYFEVDTAGSTRDSEEK